MARNKKRILVLTRPKNIDDPMAGNYPLGTPKELNAALANFNTLPDSPIKPHQATAILYGPGYTVEYPQGHDSIMQAMVVVNNTDFAWPVLSKICQSTGWKMQDTESGQIFG